MTLKKSMKFDESPVLRSLEKVAIDRGLVTPDPVVKTAAAAENFAPSSDLHDDMLRLVAGLRAKGFEKEAEELEDRVNARKFAKTQLDEKDGEALMELAHPEGDVEVAPSSSGLGKVWTDPGAQKEILKVVKKQPTGKLSAIYHDMVKTAGESNTTNSQAKSFITSSNAYNIVYAWVKTYYDHDDVDDIEVQGEGWLGEDELKEGTKKLVHTYPRVASWLKAKYSEGKDPISFWTRAKQVADNNWRQYLNSGTIDLGHLLQAVLNEKHEDVWKETLWMPGKDPNKKSSGGGGITKEQLNIVSGHLNAVATWLDKQMGESEGKDRVVANLKSKTVSWRKTINQLDTPTSIDKVNAALGFNQKDITSLRWWAKKTWPAQVRDVVKKAYVNNDFTKLAQPAATEVAGVGGSKKDDKKVPVEPTGGEPTYRGGGFLTGAIQQELLNLRDIIKKYKGSDFAVEKLSLPDHGKDGRWGTETSEAVGVAKAIHKKYKVQSPEIAKANTPATLANLKAMIAAINAGKWSSPDGSGAGSGKKQGVTYDKIPSSVDTSTVTSAEGTIDTPQGAFSSLAVFHAFLLNSGLMEQEFAQGQEMVYMKKLQDALLWFQKRSQWKASQKLEQKERKLALRYRSAVASVIRQFITLVNSIQEKYKQLPTWIPVDWLSKEEYAGPGAGAGMGGLKGGPGGYGAGPDGKGGAGGKGRSGYGIEGAGGGSGYKQRGPSGGLMVQFPGGAGGEIPKNAYPPISRYIDLGEQWWTVPQEETLDWEVVGRMSGPIFAQQYFGDAKPSRDAWYKAVINAGYDPRNKSQLAAAFRDPNFLKELSVIKGQGANYAAMAFMQKMRSEIPRVLRQWSQGLDPATKRSKLYSIVNKSARVWIRRFMRMEQQIASDQQQGY